VVKRTAVPRVDGTPENETVCKVIIDLRSGYHGDRFRIEVEGVGNIVAGDPRRARILIGVHYDGVLGGSDVQAQPLPPRLLGLEVGQMESKTALMVSATGDESGVAATSLISTGPRAVALDARPTRRR
jgi:hypothetical protein